MREQKLFEHEIIATEAYMCGFFKISSSPKECKHINCGYVEKSNCYGHKVDTEQIRYCSHRDWCEKGWLSNYGFIRNKPRPKNCGKLVKCSRTAWTALSNAELSDPNTKPDAVCIRVVVAYPNSVSNTKINWGFYLLYNLIGESLVNDSWWQPIGKKLIPHTGNGKIWPPPSKLANLNEIVSSMKKVL